jgi:glutamate racemase
MLACTHYPLLIPVLRDFLPEGVRLVDSATTCAEHVRGQLTDLDLLTDGAAPGTLQIHLTDLSDQFEDLARRFLARPPGRIQRVSL